MHENGTPGGGRTLNLLVRSQTLYPIELRAHTISVFPTSFNLLHFPAKANFCGKKMPISLYSGKDMALYPKDENPEKEAGNVEFLG